MEWSALPKPKVCKPVLAQALWELTNVTLLLPGSAEELAMFDMKYYTALVSEHMLPT